LSRNIEEKLDILRIIEQAEDILASQGFDKSSLAKKLGFPSRYIADIKAGKSKNPGSDFILALINRLNFNPAWLETGEGEAFLSERSLEATSSTKVPLLSQKVSCGPGQSWNDEQNIEKYIDIFSVFPRVSSRELYMFHAKGSSMLGAGIREGDYVLFDSQSGQYLRDGTYVFSLDNEVLCKRLEFDRFKEKKKVKIFSVRIADLEKAELLITLDADDSEAQGRLHIFGRVVGSIRPEEM
jgi:SOS-response transcriptional repressor LexA